MKLWNMFCRAKAQFYGEQAFIAVSLFEYKQGTYFLRLSRKWERRIRS